MSSEKGAARLIQLEPQEINIKLSSPFASLLQLKHLTESGVINTFELNNNISYLTLHNPYHENHVIVLTSKYTGNEIQDIEFNITVDELQGDINGDGYVNVSDIVLIIASILNSEFDEISDINQDGILNVLDIITLVKIILNF